MTQNVFWSQSQCVETKLFIQFLYLFHHGTTSVASNARLALEKQFLKITFATLNLSVCTFLKLVTDKQ